jgi:hypothetical protein
VARVHESGDWLRRTGVRARYHTGSQMVQMFPEVGEAARGWFKLNAMEGSANLLWRTKVQLFGPVLNS